MKTRIGTTPLHLPSLTDERLTELVGGKYGERTRLAKEIELLENEKARRSAGHPETVVIPVPRQAA